MKKRFKKFNLGINESQSLRLALLPISLIMLLMLSLVSCGDEEPEDSWSQTSTDIEIMNSLAEEGGCWQLICRYEKDYEKWDEFSYIDNGLYEYFWLTKEHVEDPYNEGRTCYLAYVECSIDDKTRFIKSFFTCIGKQLCIDGIKSCIGDIITHTADEMILELNLEKNGIDGRYLLRKVDRRCPTGVEWDDLNDPARYDSSALY